jgi:hypothetical protein
MATRVLSQNVKTVSGKPSLTGAAGLKAALRRMAHTSKSGGGA